MREVKFRAWDKRRKEMVEIGRIIFFSPTEKGDWAQILPPFEKEWLLIPSEANLMQFTGLSDKNGKEIYEGDVVIVYEYLNGEIWEGHCHNAVIEQGCGGWTINPCWCHQSINQELEVIGNVHENLELVGAEA